MNILYDDQGSKVDFQEFSSLQVKKTRKVKKSRANRKLLLFASCRSTTLITSSPIGKICSQSWHKIDLKKKLSTIFHLHRHLAAFFSQSWHKHMKYLEHGQQQQGQVEKMQEVSRRSSLCCRDLSCSHHHHSPQPGVVMIHHYGHHHNHQMSPFPSS